MAGSQEVLTQSEIDELLNALSKGAVSAAEIQVEQRQRKVKVYDFKRPDKFSKDQIRTFHMLHENFARLLNTYLSAHLRAIVHVDVASVDQLTYEEFIRSLSTPSVIGVFQMPPLKGNVIMEFNPNIVFSIIDRMFGGTGLTNIKPRALTDIEEAIMRRVISKALVCFRDAWKQVIDTQPRLETIESNPQFTQIVPPNDMVVIVTLKTRIGQAEGLINICIPYLVLEPIMSKLTTTFWVASSMAKKSANEHTNLLQKKLEQTLIPISVQLGQASVTVRELLELEVGDVLPIDTKISDDLSMLIGLREKFKCKPGVVGNKLAVQITQVIGKGDEDQ